METWRALADKLDELGAESVCFHTDILAFGPRDPSWGRARTLSEYERLLRDAIGGRTALFPTFNYDYFKTRVYDAERDKCQVGALNEHFRRRPDARRTLTPVFNFCVINSASHTPPSSSNFSFEPQPIPFSERSTFAEMCRNKTWLVFLGASLSHSTLIHLCDYRAETGFRYLKHFPGTVLSGGESAPVDFSFRVRVMHPLMPVTYDWERLEREMTGLGIIRPMTLGAAKILFYRADQAVDCWSEILRKDELGLYTEDGKRSVQKLYDTLGYPLTMEMFEGKA